MHCVFESWKKKKKYNEENNINGSNSIAKSKL